jgi:4-amino-4-deoxy-L-arabinose transferase-like glycosyltransferase
MTTSTTSIKLLKKEYTFSSRAILTGIIIIAILLRLASAVVQGNQVTELPGIFDQVSYHELAIRVIDGHGFSFATEHWPVTRAGEPTAHWSFLYTLYLAAIYKVLGVSPLIARMLQAIIVGELQTYIMYRIGEKMFSRNIGLIAAAISALYIYFVYYGGALMTEPFYITAILYSLFFGMQISENADRRTDIKLGLALGLAIGITLLLRQVFLLFLPFLFLWIWFARFRRRLGLPILPTVISFTLIALCILPITVYNQSRFGRFVLLNTNSGYAFFWGNHPVYGTHFEPILPAELGTYQELIPPELLSLDEAALDQELLKRGIQFVIDDPERYVLLSLSRIPAYFMFWPSSSSNIVSNVSRVASFGIMLPFMVYGIWITITKKGRRLLDLLASSDGLFLAFILIYSTVHLLTWALIRYRLPVDATLIPFAALAMQSLYSRIYRSKI